MTTASACRRGLVALSLAAAAAGPAPAHDMWANAFAETDAAGTTSVFTSIGWGHSPRPLSEFIAGGRVSGYDIVSPDGSVTALPFDAEANADLDLLGQMDTVPGLATAQGGDAFARRLIFGEGTATGTWRVHTGVPARVTTVWINAAGDSVSEPRFADEITEASRIVSSVATTRGATAYWTRGEWTAPAPAPVALELLPLDDLSAARAGDTLSFAIHRDGEPAEGLVDAVVGAIAPSGEEVVGEIADDGTVTITLSEPGFWIVRSTHLEPAEAAGEAFSDFAGRVENIRFIATVAFDAAP